MDRLAGEPHPCGNLYNGDFRSAAFGPKVESCDRHDRIVADGMSHVKSSRLVMSMSKITLRCVLTHVMTAAHSRSVSYQPPGIGPRGRWARYLRHMRKELGWSQTKAFEALREGLKLGPKSRASYTALESGKRQPRVGEQEFFIRYFGKSPDDLPDDPGDTEPADLLIAALHGQTAAITALVGRLDRLTATQAAIDAAREDPPGEPEADPPAEPAASFRRRRSDGETPPQSQP
jgi:transcriptional regulator with XRE-family HTH domain